MNDNDMENKNKANDLLFLSLHFSKMSDDDYYGGTIHQQDWQNGEDSEGNPRYEWSSSDLDNIIPQKPKHVSTYKPASRRTPHGS